MPRAPKQCATCSALTAGGKTYCDQCQPNGWATHPSARNTRYSRTETRAFHRAVLAREPNCRQCGAPATQADHIIPRQPRRHQRPPHQRRRALRSVPRPQDEARTTPAHRGG